MKKISSISIALALLLAIASCNFWKKDKEDTPEEKKAYEKEAASRIPGLDEKGNSTTGNYNTNQNGQNNNGYNQNGQDHTNNGYDQNAQHTNTDGNNYNQNSNNSGYDQSTQSTSSNNSEEEVAAQAYIGGCNAFKANNYANAEALFTMAINSYQKMGTPNQLYISSFYFLAAAQSYLGKSDQSCQNLQTFHSMYSSYPTLHTQLVEQANVKAAALYNARCK